MAHASTAHPIRRVTDATRAPGGKRRGRTSWRASRAASRLSPSMPSLALGRPPGHPVRLHRPRPPCREGANGEIRTVHPIRCRPIGSVRSGSGFGSVGSLQLIDHGTSTLGGPALALYVRRWPWPGASDRHKPKNHLETPDRPPPTAATGPSPAIWWRTRRRRRNGRSMSSPRRTRLNPRMSIDARLIPVKGSCAGRPVLEVSLAPSDVPAVAARSEAAAGPEAPVPPEGSGTSAG